jgi:hypothetical protein
VIRSISLDDRLRLVVRELTARDPTGQESQAGTRHQVKQTRQS